jgi:hypothetical protein
LGLASLGCFEFCPFFFRRKTVVTKSKSERRTEGVLPRFTPAKKAELEQIARKLGCSESEVLRRSFEIARDVLIEMYKPNE